MGAPIADPLNRHRRPKIGLRPLLICLPIGCAFALNDITSIESSRLAFIGLSTDSTLLALAPILLFVLWITCFQFWLSSCRSKTEWLIRLAVLGIASMVIINGTWLFAFRNTATMRLLQIPKPDEIQSIERKTGLKLSLMSAGNDCSILFDNRAPSTQNELKNGIV